MISIRPRRSLLFMASLLTFILIGPSCSRNPVTGQRELMLLSTEQEVAMGQQADPEIVAAFGLYDDPRLQRFIEAKGQEMVAVSHRKDIEYSFKVLDSPVVNAFAVPGGYVYFTRGIMAHFNNEAEFAGVLGHEIGHITARHTASQQSKVLLAQLGLAVGMAVSPELAEFGELASQGVGLLFFKFGRDDERQSDELGVEYSTTVGYDATEMAGFFETLQRVSQAEGTSPLPTFLSTHPSPAERLERVTQLSAEWKQRSPQEEFKIGRDNYLRLIDGLVYGEDPKQGFFEDGMFHHPELKFQFSVPQGWAKQNTPQAVQMAPEDGKALITLTLAEAASLEEAAQELLDKYGSRLVEQRDGTVNGLPALVLVAEQPEQPEQQRPAIRMLTHLIRHEGRIFSIMGISTAADHARYAATFTEVGMSFAPLTDPEKLGRTPERIQVREVAREGTLQQALRELDVPQERLEEVAILNGMRLDERIEKNSLLKTITRE